MELDINTENWIVEELADGGVSYTNPNPLKFEGEPHPVPADILDLSEEQLEFLMVESQINMIRQKRNQLLLESDWTQGKDCTLSQEKIAAWAEYRKALRDVTDNINSVDAALSVTWPSKPQ